MRHPLTGQGIRNSNIYSQKYGADRVGRTIHSQYIQVAADSGIPAMLVYIAMLGTALLYLRRCRRRCRQYVDEQTDEQGDSEPDPLTRQLIAIALGCETSLLIFAFGGVFLSLEVFELPWALLVVAGVMPDALDGRLRGMASVEEPAKSKRRRKRKRRRQREVNQLPAPNDMPEGLTYP